METGQSSRECTGTEEFKAGKEGVQEGSGSDAAE